LATSRGGNLMKRTCEETQGSEEAGRLTAGRQENDALLQPVVEIGKIYGENSASCNCRLRKEKKGASQVFLIPLGGKEKGGQRKGL